jgi:glycine/D-amino acid oxidase-like deaminating enzyme
MTHYDVAIIGNGSIGYATAVNLLRKNPELKIAIVGRQEQHGAASWAAGGMLNLFAELEYDTLHHPLLAERFEFARKAKGYWDLYASKLDIGIEWGTVLLNSSYGTDLDDENLAAVEDALVEFNEPHYTINHMPGVEPVRQYRTKNYIVIPEEGWIDPLDLKFAAESYLFDNLATACYDANARVLRPRTADGITVEMDGDLELEADNVLVCAGTASGAILEASGIKTQKITAATGFGWTIECPDVKIFQVIRSTNRFNACGITLIPRGNNKYYVGATSEASADASISTPRLGSIYSILDQLMKEINPKFASARILTEHHGHRPMSEDGLPLLGETSFKGVFVGTGTKRDGLFMSPMIGSYMADLIVDGINQFPEIFAPEREPLEVMSADDLSYRNERFAKAYEETHTLR